jgi:signal transduction histidine kinase
MTSDHELGDRLRRAFESEAPPEITVAEIRERAAKQQEREQHTDELAATGTEGRTRAVTRSENFPAGTASEASDKSVGPSLMGLEEDGRDLFGLAAHKLNTPLATIRGFVSTLLQRGDQLDTETVQQFLELILTQTDRLQDLVRDFLLLARADAGIEARAWRYLPRTLLLELADNLGTEGVRVRYAGDVDAEIVGDGELIMLALRPLVENGLTYGPRLGMVTVTVEAGAEVTTWEVHDSGYRLTNERISQLFRPFTRSDEPVERRGSGAGLGLTLAKAYAQVLGGQVGGRADAQGTVFWIKVPVPTANSTDAPPSLQPSET